MFTKIKILSVVAENTRVTYLPKPIVDQFVDINEMIYSTMSANFKLVSDMKLWIKLPI
jgi:hypothetical protein